MLHIPLYLDSEGDWIAAGRCYSPLYLDSEGDWMAAGRSYTFLYILTVKVTGLLLVDVTHSSISSQ